LLNKGVKNGKRKYFQVYRKGILYPEYN
jgi:hypothetical protein